MQELCTFIVHDTPRDVKQVVLQIEYGLFTNTIKAISDIDL